jgi:hypothetical protein
MTVINLASDGTLQMLFPAESRAYEAQALGASDGQSFPVKVGPPFGADHVVAIRTKESPDILRQQLKSIDGQRAPGAAGAAIGAGLENGGYAVGVVGLYTGQQ